MVAQQSCVSSTSLREYLASPCIHAKSSYQLRSLLEYRIPPSVQTAKTRRNFARTPVFICAPARKMQVGPREKQLMQTRNLALLLSACLTTGMCLAQQADP